jgi:plastocyanin
VNIRRFVALAALALVLVLALAGTGYAVSVSIGDNFYSPKTVTVAVGTTVTWVDQGQAPHSVTANDGSFDSSPGCPGTISKCLQNGDTYSHTFSTAGTIAYHCSVHGLAMSGTVIVQAAGTGGTPGTPLPNTGAGPLTGPFAIMGFAFLLVGAVVLFRLRRRA